MIRYLTLAEVLALHTQLLASSGGAAGIRDLGRVQAALAQPMSTFDGTDLYPTLVAKAAALGFSLIQGHPFVDGNKRIGHAAMEVFLVLNGFEIAASVDEQETIILGVAAGYSSREALTDWLQRHARSMPRTPA
ncbi:MAG: type II toxin-antitoxin system death-on-curing family toxin [Myxococcota bacterium]